VQSNIHREPSIFRSGEVLTFKAELADQITAIIKKDIDSLQPRAKD
jgi:hypothetical protein